MRQNPFDLRPGQVIDRYELLFPIDEGHACRIWAARLRGTLGFEKLVALKTLAAADPDARELERPLWEEARLASRLQHPNIAQYFDLIEHGGMLCLTMEWIDGVSLSSLLRQTSRAQGLPIGVAMQIVLQALRGLQAAHELCDADGERLGPVHCDVSPDALMISTAGIVKLVDFGIAKARRTIAAGDPRASRRPSFMAPEQASGAPVDLRADIFSLGLVLYLLTTGRHPFEAESLAATARAIGAKAPVIPPSELVAGYPFALEGVVLRALAHEPDDRYPSASEMLYELTLAFPEYASKAELADCVQRSCESALANRRAVLNEALERPAMATPSAAFPAAALPEPAPGSIPPTALAIEPLPSFADSPRSGAARMALAATGLAFLGAFIGTLASAPAKPPIRAAALAQAPLTATTRTPESQRSAPAAAPPPTASSPPTSASSAPEPPARTPAATGSAAPSPSTAPPARRSKQVNTPAKKRVKPTPIAQRYGI